MKKILVVVVIVVVLILVLLWSRSKDKKEVKSSEVREKRTLKLSPPSNIEVSNDNGTVHMKWKEAEGAKSYILYYSNVPNFTPETARTIGAIVGGEFDIMKVPSGTYYYQMSSINGNVESEKTPIAQFSVEICKLPSPPSNFTHKIVSQSQVEFEVLFSWNPDSTSDGYVIRLNYSKPPEGNESDHMVINVPDPVTANHLVGSLDSRVKWYATISSVAAHCGAGLPSEAILLN